MAFEAPEKFPFKERTVDKIEASLGGKESFVYFLGDKYVLKEHNSEGKSEVVMEHYFHRKEHVEKIQESYAMLKDILGDRILDTLFVYGIGVDGKVKGMQVQKKVEGEVFMESFAQRMTDDDRAMIKKYQDNPDLPIDYNDIYGMLVY